MLLLLLLLLCCTHAVGLVGFLLSQRVSLLFVLMLCG
jgi:hypothetical protein